MEKIHTIQRFCEKSALEFPIYDAVAAKDRHSVKKVGEVHEDILNMLEDPLLHRKILLHGPSGTGKSAEAEALALAYEADLIRCNAANILTAYQGSGPLAINRLFEEAILAVNKGKRVVIFIDEIDIIVNDKYDKEAGKERTAAGQALSDRLDWLDRHELYKNSITFIAATNYPQCLDQHFRDRVKSIEIGLPNTRTRECLLRKILLEKNIHYSSEIIALTAAKTENFSVRNLERLISSARTAKEKEGSALLLFKHIQPYLASEKKEATELQARRKFHEKAEAQKIKDAIEQSWFSQTVNTVGYHIALTALNAAVGTIVGTIIVALVKNNSQTTLYPFGKIT